MIEHCAAACAGCTGSGQGGGWWRLRAGLALSCPQQGSVALVHGIFSFAPKFDSGCHPSLVGARTPDPPVPTATPAALCLTHPPVPRCISGSWGDMPHLPRARPRWHQGPRRSGAEGEGPQDSEYHCPLPWVSKRVSLHAGCGPGPSRCSLPHPLGPPRTSLLLPKAPSK